MSTKEPQNFWFGLAMFLLGLIAGIMLTTASGISHPFQKSAPAPSGGQANENAPQAPQASIGDTILALAKDAGLDEAQFKTCVAENKFAKLFTDDQAGGQKAGIQGTPGNILIDMKSGNARILSGALPFESFKKNIDEMLKSPTAKSTDPSAPVASNVVPVNLAKDHVRGSTDARLALIEYSDYQCPFCHRVHPTYEQIMKEYDGKVLWVYRHFPLGFHPNAIPLANAAECANEIGGADAFWSYTDKVMASDQVN